MEGRAGWVGVPGMSLDNMRYQERSNYYDNHSDFYNDEGGLDRQI